MKQVLKNPETWWQIIAIAGRWVRRVQNYTFHSGQMSFQIYVFISVISEVGVRYKSTFWVSDQPFDVGERGILSKINIVLEMLEENNFWFYQIREIIGHIIHFVSVKKITFGSFLYL